MRTRGHLFEGGLQVVCSGIKRTKESYLVKALGISTLCFASIMSSCMSLVVLEIQIGLSSNEVAKTLR